MRSRSLADWDMFSATNGVDVFSRQQAESLIPRPGFVAISITACSRSMASLHREWEDILFLQFDDVGANEENCFSRGQANAIIEFARRHEDKCFMVHCDAGLSRSVAVGLFLAAWLEKDLRTHACKTVQFYNAHVHALLMRVLNEILYEEGKEAEI